VITALLGLAAACAAGPAAPESAHAPPDPDPAMTAPDPLHEVELQVSMLSNRVPADRAAPAEAWLVAHADDSRPVLLRRLGDRGPESKRILGVLARIGDAADVPAMAAVLDADDELLSFPAARALAQHPAAVAGDALVAALDGGGHTRRAALDGLALQGDATRCTAALPLLDHPDATTRYHALRAVDALGCLDGATLDRMRADPDPDVAALAASLSSG